jgi:hypothetical protein
MVSISSIGFPSSIIFFSSAAVSSVAAGLGVARQLDGLRFPGGLGLEPVGENRAGEQQAVEQCRNLIFISEV